MKATLILLVLLASVACAFAQGADVLLDVVPQQAVAGDTVTVRVTLTTPVTLVVFEMTCVFYDIFRGELHQVADTDTLRILYPVRLDQMRLRIPEGCEYVPGSAMYNGEFIPVAVGSGMVSFRRQIETTSALFELQAKVQ